jgi:hypothetical protein
MSDFQAALDVLMKDAHAIIAEVADDEGTFTFEAFFYTLIQRNQRAYIEFLYLCKDHERPFNSAHTRIGKRISDILGPEYTNDNVDGETIDIFHNRTKNYLYKKK